MYVTVTMPKLTVDMIDKNIKFLMKENEDLGIDTIVKKVMKNIPMKNIVVESFPFVIPIDDENKLVFNFFADKRYCILQRNGIEDFKFTI